ncbi:MAG: NADP-dependent oxidoreductase [Pseudonocardiales bacterium]|nr:MAG: NADP-dependent oxidoreductase [Pseudonocardiales bacterium]
MPVTAREWNLVARPHGEPSPDCFELVGVELADPGPGEVLVRNTWLSVDPYMRSRMDDRESYVPPYRLNEPMVGGAVGVVEASNHPDLAPGDTVAHELGWRDRAVMDRKDAHKIDTTAVPAQAHLNVLSMIGLTAYAGLLDVAAMKAGDTVFVSGAAGAVGSLAGQMARLKGAGRVVGSAGSAEKVAWLVDEAGFDAAFNYKDGPVRKLLRGVAPDGIDVYFDNVGGEHLEAAIGSMKLHGRIAVCGMISVYNATSPPPGPRNLPLFIARRLSMRGFLVFDYGHLRPEFLREVGAWYAEGRIVTEETVTDGVENTVEAFLGLLRGANIGKMLVRLAP